MTNPWRGLELGTVIAEKRLFLDGEGSVRVRIGQPLLAHTPHSESACPWQIDGIGSGKVRYAAGIDQVQALWLAMQSVGGDLYASEEYRAGRLKAFADGNDWGDLGFPVPRGFEDLLPQCNVEDSTKPLND